MAAVRLPRGTKRLALLVFLVFFAAFPALRARAASSARGLSKALHTAQRVAAAAAAAAAAEASRELPPVATPAMPAGAAVLLRPSPSPPYRALIGIHKLQHGTEKGDEYHPYFQYTLYPPDGAYPV